MEYAICIEKFIIKIIINMRLNIKVYVLSSDQFSIQIIFLLILNN